MLISNAYAQTAASSDPTGGLMGLLPMVAMFALLWFLMIRPQMRKAKEHKALVESLAKGDEVITQGGIAGKIAEVGETYLLVEVADGVRVKLQKQAVGTVLPKGSLKSL
ncbi:MAG: preprotein translocase subunit YajC [Rhodocyclaceae bacterium]|nr:preprotein translocase subunit YajC [Rhodocyclaceae bacterium]